MRGLSMQNWMQASALVLAVATLVAAAPTARPAVGQCADQSRLTMRAERLKTVGQQEQIKNLHRACGIAGPR